MFLFARTTHTLVNKENEGNREAANKLKRSTKLSWRCLDCFVSFLFF